VKNAQPACHVGAETGLVWSGLASPSVSGLRPGSSSSQSHANGSATRRPARSLTSSRRSAGWYAPVREVLSVTELTLTNARRLSLFAHRSWDFPRRLAGTSPITRAHGVLCMVD
jgi:hypothetical protein